MRKKPRKKPDMLNAKSSRPRSDKLNNITAGSKVNSKIFVLIVMVVAVGVLVAATHWPALSTKAISFDDRQ